MRKINNIFYISGFVIGISLFISGCLFKSGVENKAWFKYASKHDQVSSKRVETNADEKEIMQRYAATSKIEQKFLRAEQPTEAEIISVLRSPNRRFQRVGLAAMSLKPIETDQLIGILFEFLQDQDRDFRYYTIASLKRFTEFPESRRSELGKQLLEIIKNEKDQGIFFGEILLLAQFPSEEAAGFLTEQLMKEGKENSMIRELAFSMLKQMGDSFYNKAAEYVKNNGSPEIKKELLERENQWKRVHNPTEKE